MRPTLSPTRRLSRAGSTAGKALGTSQVVSIEVNGEAQRPMKKRRGCVRFWAPRRMRRPILTMLTLGVGSEASDDARLTWFRHRQPLEPGKGRVSVAGQVSERSLRRHSVHVQGPTDVTFAVASAVESSRGRIWPGPLVQRQPRTRSRFCASGRLVRFLNQEKEPT